MRSGESFLSTRHILVLFFLSILQSLTSSLPPPRFKNSHLNTSRFGSYKQLLTNPGVKQSSAGSLLNNARTRTIRSASSVISTESETSTKQTVTYKRLTVHAPSNSTINLICSEFLGVVQSLWITWRGPRGNFAGNKRILKVHTRRQGDYGDYMCEHSLRWAGATQNIIVRTILTLEPQLSVQAISVFPKQLNTQTSRHLTSAEFHCWVRYSQLTARDLEWRFLGYDGQQIASKIPDDVTSDMDKYNSVLFLNFPRLKPRHAGVYSCGYRKIPELGGQKVVLRIVEETASNVRSPATEDFQGTERKTPVDTCMKKEFICDADKRRLSVNARCDGKLQCPDGQDEIGCLSPVLISPSMDDNIGISSQIITLDCVAFLPTPGRVFWSSSRNREKLDSKCDCHEFEGGVEHKCSIQIPPDKQIINTRYFCQADSGPHSVRSAFIYLTV